MNDVQGGIAQWKVRSLKYADFGTIRIPGIRRFIKYKIHNKSIESRIWLVIIAISLAVTFYNATHYVKQYYSQHVTIVRTYEYPSKIMFPKIILCMPFSYSYSALLNHQGLIPGVLDHLEDPNHTTLMTSLEGNLSSKVLLDLFTVNIGRSMLDCTFRKKSCDSDLARHYHSAAHSCMVLNGHKHFVSESTTDRLKLLLNLNFYDGIEERPGLAGGLKLIFLNPRHLNLPYSSDIAYLDTGRLNIIGLSSHRRKSAANCTEAKVFVGKKTIEMNPRQVRFRNQILVKPCLLENYATTKTSGKLRSKLIYDKLDPQYLTQLQLNASTANQLRAKYVHEIREKDIKVAQELATLTRALRKSFLRWEKPACSEVRHVTKMEVSVTYIRGKAEALTAYMHKYLLAFAKMIHVNRLFLMSQGPYLLEHAHDVVGISFGNKNLFRRMVAAVKQFEDFSKTESKLRLNAKSILDILGTKRTFQRLTDNVIAKYANNYATAHVEFKRAIQSMMSCVIGDKQHVIKDAPFVHTGAISCMTIANRTIHYGNCPNEVMCPNFGHGYMQKYNGRHSYMIDTTMPSKSDVHASIFMFCAMTCFLKDAVRAYGADFDDEYPAWFDVLRLNRIATAQWTEDRIFESHDIECRTYQACWRLLASVTTRSLSFSQEHWQNIMSIKEAPILFVEKFGSIGFNIFRTCDIYRVNAQKRFQDYLEVYYSSIVKPFEAIYSTLVNFRQLIPLVRRYEVPLFTMPVPYNSLIQQFEDHLHNYIKTSNLSALAYFLDRRGRIMIGEMRIYLAQMQTFIDLNYLTFKQVTQFSSTLFHKLTQEPNVFLRILRQNVTESVLSSNFSEALNVIRSTGQCAKVILNSLAWNGKDTINRMTSWLQNIQPFWLRARHYQKTETLDADFVKNNFVQIELHYENMNGKFEEELFPMDTMKLISHLGAVGRCYMGLKIFNMAELVGPIVLFFSCFIYFALCKLLSQIYWTFKK